MSTLGQRIKAIRKQNAVTQQEFSQRVCVSQSYLSRLEADKEVPTEMLLKLIALEFNISYTWLQDGTGTMSIAQERGDYFVRNDPGFIGSAQHHFQRLLELIEKAQSSYLELSIGGILVQIEIIIRSCHGNHNQSDILIDTLASICVNFAEFIEKTNALDFSSPDNLKELYRLFFSYTDEITEICRDVLKGYEKRFVQ